ncbi:hypothetical protein L210DRAFT_347215, partial [Boletus edulis BED1]
MPAVDQGMTKMSDDMNNGVLSEDPSDKEFVRLEPAIMGAGITRRGGVEDRGHLFSQPTPLTNFPSSFTEMNPRSCSAPLIRVHCGIQDRVAREQAQKQARLQRTAELDKYMPTLKQACPYHFVHAKSVVADDYPRCSWMGYGNLDGYKHFKNSLTFESYTYCYRCGMPQERQHNGEGPMCHMNHNFRSKLPCPYSHFIFRVAYRVWEVLELRVQMMKDLGEKDMPMTQDQFEAWALEEEEGRYNNLLEVFLWFCRKVDRENPRIFGRVFGSA